MRVLVRTKARVQLSFCSVMGKAVGGNAGCPLTGLFVSNACYDARRAVVGGTIRAALATPFFKHLGFWEARTGACRAFVFLARPFLFQRNSGGWRLSRNEAATGGGATSKFAAARKPKRWSVAVASASTTDPLKDSGYHSIEL